jgi:hypothetical protein
MKSSLNCPYCKSPIESGSPAVRCPECATLHHSSCWEENGACSIFGCSSTEPKTIRKILLLIPPFILALAMLNTHIAVQVSFLFFPALLFCIIAGGYSLISLIEAGLIRRTMTRAEIKRHLLYLGLYSLSICLGLSRLNLLSFLRGR